MTETTITLHNGQAQTDVTENELSSIAALQETLEDSTYAAITTETDPLDFAVQIVPTLDGYRTEAVLHDAHSKTAREHLSRVADIQNLDQQTLQTSDTLDRLVSGGVTEPHELPEQPPHTETDELRIGQEDGTVGLIQGQDGDHYALHHRHTGPPRRFGLDPLEWGDTATDPVQLAYETGHLTVDTEALDQELEDRSHEILYEIEERIEDMDAYASMDTVYGTATNLPEEWHRLREVYEDDDLRVSDEHDLVKTTVLEPEDQIGELALSVLDLEQDPEGLRLSKYRKEADTIEQIGEAYRDWKQSLSFERAGHHDDTAKERALEFASDLAYNEESIRAFCENADLSENDGYFITALAEHTPAEEVTVPDMDGVGYLGYRQASTRIIIEGDTGDWLGSYMEGGEIVVKGSTEGNITYEMDGGSIYIQDGDVDTRRFSNVYESLPEDMQDTDGGLALWPFS